MKRSPNGIGGQLWEHESESGVTESLLLDNQGRWEVADKTDKAVVGIPRRISPENAREILNTWEEGAGDAFFAWEIRGEIRRMQVDVFNLQGKIHALGLELEKLE